jgi:hypothetical protein
MCLISLVWKLLACLAVLRAVGNLTKREKGWEIQVRERAREKNIEGIVDGRVLQII